MGRKGTQQAARSLDGRRAGVQAVAGHRSGSDAHAGRPPTVVGLGHGAEVLEDASGVGGGQCERVGALPGVEPPDDAGRRSSAQGSEDGGRVPALVVVQVPLAHEDIAPHFVSDRIGPDQGRARHRCGMRVGGSQHGGDQHGAGVVRKREVVVVQGMCRRGIDQGRLRGRQPGGTTDTAGLCGPALLDRPACQCAYRVFPRAGEHHTDRIRETQHRDGRDRVRHRVVGTGCYPLRISMGEWVHFVCIIYLHSCHYADMTPRAGRLANVYAYNLALSRGATWISGNWMPRRPRP